MLKPTLFITVSFLVVMGTALRVTGSNQNSEPKGYQLASCFKCHDGFKDPAVLATKQAEAISRVQSGKMPPGVTLTEAEKSSLIKQIQQSSR
jgi:hypothetical protein